MTVPVVVAYALFIWVVWKCLNSTAKAVTCTGSPRRLTSENRQSPHVINRLVPATSYKHVYTFTCSPQGCLCVGTTSICHSHAAHDNLQFFHYRHKITCKKNYRLKKQGGHRRITAVQR